MCLVYSSCATKNFHQEVVKPQVCRGRTILAIVGLTALPLLPWVGKGNSTKARIIQLLISDGLWVVGMSCGYGLWEWTLGGGGLHEKSVYGASWLTYSQTDRHFMQWPWAMQCSLSEEKKSSDYDLPIFRPNHFPVSFSLILELTAWYPDLSHEVVSTS